MRYLLRVPSPRGGHSFRHFSRSAADIGVRSWSSWIETIACAFRLYFPPSAFGFRKDRLKNQKRPAERVTGDDEPDDSLTRTPRMRPPGSGFTPVYASLVASTERCGFRSWASTWMSSTNGIHDFRVKQAVLGQSYESVEVGIERVTP